LRARLERSLVGFTPFCPERSTTRRTREIAALSVTESPLNGPALLTAVSDAMSALHERHHHRRPVTARTHLLGDELLVCILGGVYTEVEKTMIERQKTVVVQETRSEFQQAVEHRFTGAVERLSGREVLVFISNSHVGPDLEIEIFLLAPPTVTPTMGLGSSRAV